ncbi:hypothetical protein BC940DRAFT_308827 [Gongronella butleri]|nr:hypothetical protein BC940DRAFT_308827 [Gongronella butleri]
MTFFNKISNFAQKTKEAALARAILAKDKRLDTALGGVPETPQLDMVTTFGLPSKVATLAYDPVAGLLVTVTRDQEHLVLNFFGRGVMSSMGVPGVQQVKYLQFKTGQPCLVLIDTSNVVYLIDLRQRKVQHVLRSQGIITSCAYCTGTDWLFLGMADGYTDVLDTRLGKLASYSIPDLLQADPSQAQPQQEQQQPEQSQPKARHMVVGLESHPSNVNWLLIAYDRVVFLWDIKEQQIHDEYHHRSPSSNAHITSLTWHPRGDAFVTGDDHGQIHVWSVSTPSKPMISRPVFPAIDNAAASIEPVYKLAWYQPQADDTTSCLIVAGGTSLQDMHGVHLLELDGPHDARKQSMLPCAADVADFVVLWSDAYARSQPIGIVIVAADGSISSHQLTSGFPRFTLPPALSLLDPLIANMCFLPMVHPPLYHALTTVTEEDRQLLHLPLMGGSVSPRHIYKLASNDILMTLHVGEIIQFWDASYTTLRPLPQLTIQCHDNMPEGSSVFVCTIDINASNGAAAIGFNDGTVLLYEFVHPTPAAAPDHREDNDTSSTMPLNVGAQFIEQCDDTINELQDILDDMKKTSIDDDEPHDDQNDGKASADDQMPQTAPPKEAQIAPTSAPASTNPFESADTNHTAAPGPSSADDSKPSESTNPFEEPARPSISSSVQDTSANDASTAKNTNGAIISAIKRSEKPFGYVPDLKIQLDSAVSLMASAGDDLLACATCHHRIYVIHTTLQKVIACFRIQDFPGLEVLPQDHENANASPMPSITTLYFSNTYAHGFYTHESTVLFIGLENGQLFEIDIASLQLHFVHAFNGSVVDVHCIDQRGVPQKALQHHVAHGSEPKRAGPPAPPAPPVEPVPAAETVHAPAPAPTRAERSKSFLRRKPTKKKKDDHQGDVAADDQWDALTRSSTVTTTSSAGSNASIERKAKHEYQPQERPHFVLVASPTSIACLLAGYSVKLYDIDLPEQDGTLTRITPVQLDDIACLSVLMSSGNLLLLSLPHLTPVARIPLATNSRKLKEATLTTDGRILSWHGAYEMKEWIYIHSASTIPYGHDVQLFDIERRLPPHPSQIQPTQQTNKKTWFGAVAGVFKKEPLRLEELDLISKHYSMGCRDTGRKLTRLFLLSGTPSNDT